MKNLNYLIDIINVSDIQDSLEYMIKKHETLTDKSPVQICVNKFQNRITFKI